MDTRLVCVTGASGFIASWLVKLLLERGYRVRGTVRSLADPLKTSHLKALPGADGGLQLVEADLLSHGSFDAAFEGCDAVFHTASPFFMKNVTDPESQLIQPAVQGTLNVLGSCYSHKVRKVIVTSSMASVAYLRDRGPNVELDDRSFSDSDYCKETKSWYVLSKTLAEQAAWDFAKEKHLDLVTIHPAMVIGPMLQPTLNTSSEVVLRFLDGTDKTYPDFAIGWVGVKDTALAHILAYENPSASGRYLCVERILHYGDFVSILRKLYPGYPIPTSCQNDPPRASVYKVNTSKLQEIGMTFSPLETNIKECVESLKANKFISYAQL